MESTETIAIGKAGQLVTAILQSAGIYGQSNVLTYFGTSFDTFGAAIYLLALLVAVCSVAIFGNYKAAGYLLVGPGIFYWLLFSNVMSDGTTFQFGARVDDGQRELQRGVLEDSFSSIDLSRPARVSYFYAAYDNLVSHVVQKLVATLVDTELKQDMIALARERMFTRVVQNRSVDPNFLKLFTLYMQGECAQFIKHKFALAQPQMRYPDPKDKLGNLFETKKKLQELVVEQGSSRVVALAPVELTEYLKGKELEFDEASNTATCDQVWTMVVKLLEEESRVSLEPTTAEKSQFDVPWEQVIGDVQRQLCGQVVADGCGTASEADLQRVAERIVLAQSLKNTQEITPHAMFMSQAMGRELWDKNVVERYFGNIVARQENSNRFLLVYLASVIPYIQGIMLYLLSVSFPFFALFVLMPNRFGSFFVWLTLWAWVKSWDLGYAIVFLLREVLWDIFPHVGTARLRSNFTVTDWTADNPNDLLNLVYASDPTVNSTLYWTIVSSLTCSVPLITAYLCLGASSVYDAFKMSLDQRPQEYSEDVRQGSLRNISTESEAGFQHNLLNKTASGAQDAVRNPGTVKGARRDNLFGNLVGAGMGADTTFGNYMHGSAMLERNKAILDSQGVENYLDRDASSTRAALLYFGQIGPQWAAYNNMSIAEYHTNSDFSTLSNPMLKSFSSYGVNDFGYGAFAPDHGGLKIFANMEGE